jgi:hypothetical protein
MVGSSDDAEELCKELNELLGRNEFGWYVNGESIGISAANLTEEEIERLNLTEDFKLCRTFFSKVGSRGHQHQRRTSIQCWLHNRKTYERTAVNDGY